MRVSTVFYTPFHPSCQHAQKIHEGITYFTGNLNADTLVMNLTAYLRAPMTPGKTLVFFDEIQECPAARTAMKFLVEDGRFDYIESGSLPGVNYKEVQSYPVGYEEMLMKVTSLFKTKSF